jgi:DNA-binding NtrC family response regulator
MEPKSWSAPMAQEDKPVVLVVDDEEHMRELIAQTLSAQGLTCIPATSVNEANSALKTAKISLMILDWNLDRRGVEVIRFARELQPLLPVLVISGHPDDPRTDALVEQADAFLEKPFNLTLFTNQVSRLLLRSQSAPDPFLPRKPEDIQPLKEVKRQYIRVAAKLLNNNISRTAERLGVHRQTVAAALNKAGAPGSDTD